MSIKIKMKDRVNIILHKYTKQFHKVNKTTTVLFICISTRTPTFQHSFSFSSNVTFKPTSGFGSSVFVHFIVAKYIFVSGPLQMTVAVHSSRYLPHCMSPSACSTKTQSSCSKFVNVRIVLSHMEQIVSKLLDNTVY